jgi:hypothetical protein
MLQKVIISLVILFSLSVNVHYYLKERDREIELTNYTDYNVLSDKNGQVMGLMQLQTVAEPVIGDSIIIFTEDKEYYLTVNDMKVFNNLLVGNE